MSDQITSESETAANAAAPSAGATSTAPSTKPRETLDEAIKRIADSNRGYAAKGEGAKAESGDRVTVAFKGTINGEPFEGGAGEGIQVVIGAGQFIPGFEEQLIGIGTGNPDTGHLIASAGMRLRALGV